MVISGKVLNLRCCLTFDRRQFNSYFLKVISPFPLKIIVDVLDEMYRVEQQKEGTSCKWMLNPWLHFTKVAQSKVTTGEKQTKSL